LSDRQLHDLFEVAHVTGRARDPNHPTAAPATTVEEWVSVFKRKRDEVVTNRCPA
jgi:hypothetical protein